MKICLPEILIKTIYKRGDKLKEVLPSTAFPSGKKKKEFPVESKAVISVAVYPLISWF